MLLKKYVILEETTHFKRVLSTKMSWNLCNYCILWMRYNQCPSIRIGILCDNLNLNLYKFSYIVI